MRSPAWRLLSARVWRSRGPIRRGSPATREKFHHPAEAILNIVARQAVVSDGNVTRPPLIYPARDGTSRRASQLTAEIIRHSGRGPLVRRSAKDQAYAAALNLARPRTRQESRRRHGDWSSNGTTALNDQAAVEIALRDIRWPTKPSPAKPSSIVTQVEGSGTDWVPTERSGAIITNIPSTLVPSE
jgi:hypothetical protein